MPLAPPSFRPVVAAGICLGHVVHTARGWIACDRRDRELGTFPDEHDAAEALTTPTPA